MTERSIDPITVPAKVSSRVWTQVLVVGFVIALVLTRTFVAQGFMWQYAVKEVATDHLDAMRRDAYLLDARLRSRANDIFFLKRVAEQKLAQDPQAPLVSDDLRTAVSTMMLTHGQYDQVHLLDLSGHEIFRCNWKGGAVQEVLPQDLQDKSGRPYFQETLAASANAAVFSRLDLNSEQGKIEEPYKAVIRISGKIIGPDGTLRGILVMNYLADQLFRELKQPAGPSENTLLLNSEGFWLIGADPQSEWGFMLPGREKINLKEQDPALWKRITSKKAGSLDYKGSLFCFMNIDPAGTDTDYPPLRLPIVEGSRLHWILLQKIPNDTIWGSISVILVGIWTVCAAVIGILGPLLWCGVSILDRRRIATQQLQESQQRLLAAVDQEKELTRRAQAAEKAKSEFLAVMSHEIRTPMNGVIGMTSILSDTSLTDAQRDCVNTIQVSGEGLLAVINDILDFSKIESGKINLEQRPFNLHQCIEQAVDLFIAPIRQKRLEAGYLIAPEVPSSLVGDSTRLRQIITNLIGNAVKFTEKGEITLNVESRKQDDREHLLTFSVTDTGIGISREGAEGLFKSFQQVDSSTTRRYGGTGLGLAISKRLAELMGGTMWVESEPGKGSTFFFTVKMQAAPIVETVEAERGPAAMLKPCSVLIVDDNATNRNILSTQMKTWGMTSTSVASGPEALEKMNAQSFDIGLVDLQMPGMDGVTLAREIRRHSQVPLILLSSAGEVEVGEAEHLFQFQILKPVKQSQLMDALKQIAGTGVSDAPKIVTKRFDRNLASTHPLQIMLAEDNKVNQKVGLLMLARLGYQATLAENGVEAVNTAVHGRYDLILMDVQMPEMDGIEAGRQIREKLGVASPFIVALTADALEGDRERLIGLGFDDYLSKPLSPDGLQKLLRSVPKAGIAPTAES